MDLTVRVVRQKLTEETAKVLGHEYMYIALGIEIDYMAQGRTEDEVIEAFEKGFMLTVEAHKERFGHIEHFLKPSPMDLYGIEDDHEHVMDMLYSVANDGTLNL